MKRLACLTAGLLLLAGARLSPAECGGKAEGGVAPKVPGKLRPPGRHRLLLQVEADGVQIYVSKEAEKGTFVWGLTAPLADLSRGGKKAGYHYAGPTWEALDGSKLVRETREEVVGAPAPDPKADIPWLRIRVKPEGKAEGAFGKVSYVLRTQTRGGVAPRQAPTRAGTQVGVRYRATYSLYGTGR